MLVLTRKVGQQIFMGNGSIQIKILKSENGSIRLGFSAPKHIDIDREEVFVRKNLPVDLISEE